MSPLSHYRRIGGSMTGGKGEPLTGALRKVPGIVVATLSRDLVEATAHGALEASPEPASLCWEIGSITKVFTGLLLAEMSIRGEVGLDDPIGRYLPESVASRLPPWGSQPTLAGLATHSAGFPRLPLGMIRKVGRHDDPYGGLTEDDVWEHLGPDTKQPSRPRHRYSNYGMGLLGHLLERAAGIPYQPLLRARVLDPLGLAATGVGGCPGTDPAVPGFRKGKPTPAWTFGALEGAGALRSTAGDLLRFAGFCIDLPPGVIGGALDLAARPHYRGRMVSAGLGWMLRPDESGAAGSAVIWHNGGTYGAASFLAVDRGRRVAVVAFGNSGPRLASPCDRVGWSALARLASG